MMVKIHKTVGYQTRFVFTWSEPVAKLDFGVIVVGELTNWHSEDELSHKLFILVDKQCPHSIRLILL